MNPSESRENVVGTLYAKTTQITAGLSGLPTHLWEGMPGVNGGKFVRWSLVDVGGAFFSGISHATQHTVRTKLLLMADVYWPAMSDDSSVGLYDVPRCIDELRDALTLASWVLYDHVTDRNSPPVALPNAHRLRVLDVPTTTRPSAVDGYDRAVVTATIVRDSYHTP